jgi:glutamine amidotransferase
MGYIAIVDYGAGNLMSVQNALRYLGLDSRITGESAQLERADSIILPGVGAFPDAWDRLTESGLDQVLKRQGQQKPVLGICLGMQMLFEKSYEFGEHRGLGLLRGSVIPMKGTIPEGLKIPQMGWNSLMIKRNHPLLQYVKEGDCVYFVHSYYATDCEESLLAACEYGKELAAAVAFENVMGCQFHPEKSSEVGMQILKNFLEV